MLALAALLRGLTAVLTRNALVCNYTLGPSSIPGNRARVGSSATPTLTPRHSLRQAIELVQCFLTSQKHSQPPYSKANTFPALKYSPLQLSVSAPKWGSLGWSWLLESSLVMVQYCQWR